MTILPAGMDGRQHIGMYGKDGALQEWQQNAAETLNRSLERPLETQRARPPMQATIRTVTPEPSEGAGDIPGISGSLRSGGFDSIHTSPRSIPGGEKPRDRRQGLVFQGSFGSDPFEGNQSQAGRLGPPVGFPSSGSSRPRTRTLEDTPRPRSTSVSKSRHRIGSVHSSTPNAYHDTDNHSTPEGSNTLGPGVPQPPARPLQKSGSIKKKDGGKGRLVKRGSRPASPHSAVPKNDIPSVDSLTFPVATADANKILMLMKTLCGRMRGEAEYQSVERGPWYLGTCYIDEIKGSLMYDGDDRGPFHLVVVENLRGCRIRPVDSAERRVKCLEISNPALGIEVRLLPTVKSDFDPWLAALLCWQQIRTASMQVSSPRAISPSRSADRIPERQPDNRRRESSLTINGSSRDATIIKVGKLLLWDKGTPLSPSSIVRRPSARDLHSASRSWRRVSCILQDNGEFKLMTENDSTLLSVIQLSQLSRCAIQRLDKSVLDEEYCIAIFPQYTSTSTTLSIFRPVYIALESRVLFEVWFVLLRALAIPEIYGPQQTEQHNTYNISADMTTSTADMFRIEKSLSLRIIEAKFPKLAARTDTSHHGKHHAKPEKDPSFGDYFFEVMLDGEIRARSMTKYETRNPFWREECEFFDLPAHPPKLSIILKRLEAPEVTSHGFLSSTSVQSSEDSLEVICGAVEIPIDKLERGKDSEAWWPIFDGRQEQIGEMFLKIRHDELVVLLAKDYQPISELLHRFSTGLTVQISQMMGQDLRKLSEILMNIFQVSGHGGEWLMALVEDEIDGVEKETPITRLRWSTRIGSNESFGTASDREQTVREMGKSLSGEANLLFRGNSLLTQALDFHMRRLGKEYLEDVLGGKIKEINDLNPDCEVDPSRLAHGDDIAKNWTQLMSLTTGIWDRIFASVTRCPAEVRTIMKYIRAVAEDRYGDFLRTVQYTSVSGFLFLRFFCPAILNPKLFGLMRDHPQPKAQRALTLVAKSLQVLANLSMFGQKEEWMVPMNKFLTSHRQDLKDYIDEICAIPAERSTFALPASYSTPITILARLPSTSREGFPSLPYLIDHARNFAALVKLWLETTSHLRPSETIDGELLEFNQLCISLQRRTDECLLKAEAADRSADQLSLQWEDMVDSLGSSSITSPAAFNPESQRPEEPEVESKSPLWTEYTTTITAGRRSATGSRESESGRKERQSFWEQTFGRDSSANKERRPSDTVDLAGQSPPSRGQSRNSGKQRSFLSGLRRKGGKGENLFDNPKDSKDLWNTGNGQGGMI